MNKTQIQNTLAPIITFFAGFLAGKGVFGWDAEVWAQVLGGAAGLAATLWAAITTRDKAIVNQTAELPKVKGVITDADMAAATPSEKVVASVSDLPNEAKNA